MDEQPSANPDSTNPAPTAIVPTSTPATPPQSRFGGFWLRAVAYVIDSVLLSPITLGAYFASLLGPLSASVAAQCVLFPVFHLYRIFCHAKWGQTVGKRLLGLQVRRVDGGKIGWTEALLRSSVDLFGNASIAFFHVIALLQLDPDQYNHLGLQSRLQLVADHSGIGTIVSLVVSVWVVVDSLALLCNGRKRTLHDMIAGTVVAQVSAAEAVRITKEAKA